MPPSFALHEDGDEAAPCRDEVACDARSAPHSDRVCVVEAPSSLNACVESRWSLRRWLERVAPLSEQRMAERSRVRVLLLVAGLRPVKDVAFLFEAVREWHRHDSRIRFVRVLGIAAFS